jgi:hypothetical protein
MPLADLVPTGQDIWLTRDRFEGALAPEVDVWVYRPAPERYRDGDVLWIAPIDVVDRRATFFCALPLKTARLLYGGAVPDDARQCVRLERARG